MDNKSPNSDHIDLHNFLCFSSKDHIKRWSLAVYGFIVNAETPW